MTIPSHACMERERLYCYRDIGTTKRVACPAQMCFITCSLCKVSCAILVWEMFMIAWLGACGHDCFIRSLHHLISLVAEHCAALLLK
ncbi:hypothetical protein DUNSADRAFT_10529 [Dunaliella salina]|uniref:Encoded protein n=1 Tax=Dunaliella salina TaxID=3046 RepID=A0ABQ7GF31_DUNSA|nr:hypothetical protein DUNSADRAFT_10529 [Dunaliella salina]|eukprot:KAF5833214.1 hypothetical protein DUNSADRAFT_10529 [Dunaliella salina]